MPFYNVQGLIPPKRHTVFKKNNKILFDKGIIKFNNSIFDIDFSVLTNESKIPLNIKGEIPINLSLIHI